MKIILFLIPLTGAALLAAAGEPVKTNAPSTPTATTYSVTKNTATDAKGATLDATDKAYAARLGQQLALSRALKEKPAPSAGGKFLQSLNPFAPMESTPETPWLSRVAWGTAAEKAVPNSMPVEVRHESHFGVVIATR
jgi:hypothetical protein